MGTYFKIFSILTARQLRLCGLIMLVMMLGAVFEAIGISAVLPLIALLGQPDFLQEHLELARHLSAWGIQTHTQFIIACTVGLILFYIVKNIYLTFELRLQIHFAVSNQMRYSTQLLARYFSKPYLYHLEQNTATLLRNVTNVGPVVFINILITTLMLFTEVFTVLMIWIMLALKYFRYESENIVDTIWCGPTTAM